GPRQLAELLYRPAPYHVPHCLMHCCFLCGRTKNLSCLCQQLVVEVNERLGHGGAYTSSPTPMSTSYSALMPSSLCWSVRACPAASCTTLRNAAVISSSVCSSGNGVWFIRDPPQWTAGSRIAATVDGLAGATGSAGTRGLVAFRRWGAGV